MIRRRRVAVSSPVQSGRISAAKRISSGALNRVPSTVEGVLNSAERGGFRGDPEPVATPLDPESLRRTPGRRLPRHPEPHTCLVEADRPQWRRRRPACGSQQTSRAYAGLVTSWNWANGGSGGHGPNLPDLHNTVIVAAFEGWNDAGDAASDALEHLDAIWEALPLIEIDDESYYDYQVNRCGRQCRSRTAARPDRIATSC